MAIAASRHELTKTATACGPKREVSRLVQLYADQGWQRRAERARLKRGWVQA